MAAPDWRNPADYALLEGLDLAALAWEFLRRNPDYGRGPPAGEDPDAWAAGWGLRFVAPAGLGADEAAVFWRAEIAPAHVIPLVVSPLGGVPAAVLAAASLARAEAGEGTYLRLSGGLQVIAPRGADPALAAAAPLDEHLPARLTALAALERLLAGRGPAAPPLSVQGRRRLVRMVRALDGRAAGASYREIAEGLLGAVADAGAWRTASVRDVAIRLCRAARRLMGGGYRGLLARRR